MRGDEKEPTAHISAAKTHARRPSEGGVALGLRYGDEPTEADEQARMLMARDPLAAETAKQDHPERDRGDEQPGEAGGTSSRRR